MIEAIILVFLLRVNGLVDCLTVHRNKSHAVVMYYDHDCSDKACAVFPRKGSKTGLTFQFSGRYGNVFGGGCLDNPLCLKDNNVFMISPRVLDGGRIYLYERPDSTSTVIPAVDGVEKVLLLDESDGWLKLAVENKSGGLLEGWSKDPRYFRSGYTGEYNAQPGMHSRGLECYSVHNNKNDKVSFYYDYKCRDKACDVFPYHQESDAGVMFVIKQRVGDAFLVDFEQELLYAKIKDSFIVAHTRAPGGTLYVSPDDNSEMIHDLLSGELAYILDVWEDWAQVKIMMNRRWYTGWCRNICLCGSPYTTCP